MFGRSDISSRLSVLRWLALSAALGGCNLRDPVEPAACSSNTDCNADAYCARSPGACSSAGRCQLIRSGPCAGSSTSAPVCGCDAATYSNPCEAEKAGTSVAHHGDCSAPGGCSVDGDCAPAQFCRYADCGAGGKGVCTARPKGCPKHIDPVCGCDGQTYSNACMADAAGVSVAQKGSCTVHTGCNSDSECDTLAGEFCKFTSSCGGSGTCTVRPPGCNKILAPVCGCDGQTHGNACMADAAGVSVASQGACPGPGSCSTDSECNTQAGEFCEFVSGCGGGGQCVVPPYCPKKLGTAPVCGCDGRTYQDPCVARGAHVSIAHHGPCPKPAGCDAINAAYVAAVDEARTCTPPLAIPQCGLAVDDSLLCGGCQIHVEASNVQAVDQIKAIKQQWDQAGCVTGKCGRACFISNAGQCEPVGSVPPSTPPAKGKCHGQLFGS